MPTTRSNLLGRQSPKMMRPKFSKRPTAKLDVPPRRKSEDLDFASNSPFPIATSMDGSSHGFEVSPPYRSTAPCTDFLLHIRRQAGARVADGSFGSAVDGQLSSWSLPPWCSDSVSDSF